MPQGTTLDTKLKLKNYLTELHRDNPSETIGCIKYSFKEKIIIFDKFKLSKHKT